jgi:hypothetical protein
MITRSREEESGLNPALPRMAQPQRKQKKAESFWARKLALRNTPGNCVKCGHKNDDLSRKTCPRCRAALKARRQKYLRQTVPVATMQDMERRIASLEISVARLQLLNGSTYERGYRAGRTHKEQLRYADAYPPITKQELATMNHAYAEEEA